MNASAWKRFKKWSSINLNRKKSDIKIQINSEFFFFFLKQSQSQHGGAGEKSLVDILPGLMVVLIEEEKDRDEKADEEIQQKLWLISQTGLQQRLQDPEALQE